MLELDQNKELINRSGNIALLIYHFVYFLFLINTNLIRPQHVFLYNLILIFIFLKPLLNNFKIIKPYILISIGSFICSIIKNDEIDSFLNIAYFLSTSVILMLYCTLKIDNRIHIVMMAIYILYVVLNLLRGIDPNFILDGKSQNMVSFYFLLYVILFNIYNQSNSFISKIAPGLILVFLSLAMFGRSGIIISALVFLGSFIFLFKEIKVTKKILLSVLFIGIIGSLVVYFGAFLEEGLSRFNKEGTSLTGREEIWSTYINLMEENELFMFFGVPLNESYVFRYVDKNLHNSFLAMHSYLGLLGTLYIGYFLYIILFIKRNPFFRFLLLILLVRATTDHVFFLKFDDYILWVLVFVILNRQSVKTIQQYSRTKTLTLNYKLSK